MIFGKYYKSNVDVLRFQNISDYPREYSRAHMLCLCFRTIQTRLSSANRGIVAYIMGTGQLINILKYVSINTQTQIPQSCSCTKMLDPGGWSPHPLTQQPGSLPMEPTGHDWPDTDVLSENPVCIRLVFVYESIYFIDKLSATLVHMKLKCPVRMFSSLISRPYEDRHDSIYCGMETQIKLTFMAGIMRWNSFVHVVRTDSYSNPQTMFKNVASPV